VEEIDMMLSLLHCPGEPMGLTSYDFLHIRGVMDKVHHGVLHHPFYDMFGPHVEKQPPYVIELKRLGTRIEGINMNLQSKNPGKQFFQKHLKRLYGEEASFETQQVYKIRKESQSEFGCVFRFAGMTNFTKASPAGQVFFDPANREKVLNFPQYVNPYWDEEEKKDRIKEYGGEDSLGYKVFVRGEIVEDGISVFDMDRVRHCLDDNRIIKTFELSKEQFNYFRNFIVVERPKNASRLFISADTGDNVTEILVHAEINGRWYYIYNIVLRNLTPVPEQYEIFKWLGTTLKANCIAIDGGDGSGRDIINLLEKDFAKENIVKYQGQSKIPVDFIYDERLYKEEFMAEWSVRRLQMILYEQMVNVPSKDECSSKFEIQFNSVISTHVGIRTVYKCMLEDDHHFDAWKVFAVAQWMHEFNLIQPVKPKEWGLGV
jgi:hypothetical protein